MGDALGTEPYQAIQVTATMDNGKTSDRETRSLVAAMKRMPSLKGTIVTLRESGQLETGADLNGRRIEVIPAWQWALQG